MTAFRLEFDPRPTRPGNLPAHPHGYWTAVTAKGGYDASGETPEAAVAGLAHVLAVELGEAEEWG